MRQFKSTLASQVEEFILYRKAGGRWSESYEVLLCNFDRYCTLNHPEDYLLTAEMAKGWCKKKPSENAATLGKRIIRYYVNSVNTCKKQDEQINIFQVCPLISSTDSTFLISLLNKNYGVSLKSATIFLQIPIANINEP